jgi:hypothetical protein
VVLLNQEGGKKYPREYMRIPFYIQDRAAVYGCLEELQIDPRTTRACTPELDINVYAWMPQKGITLKLKEGVILGQQLAIQADRLQEILEKSC